MDTSDDHSPDSGGGAAHTITLLICGFGKLMLEDPLKGEREEQMERVRDAERQRNRPPTPPAAKPSATAATAAAGAAAAATTAAAAAGDAKASAELAGKWLAEDADMDEGDMLALVNAELCVRIACNC